MVTLTVTRISQLKKATVLIPFWKLKTSVTVWHMSVILALRKTRTEGWKLNSSLGYIGKPCFVLFFKWMSTERKQQLQNWEQQEILPTTTLTLGFHPALASHPGSWFCTPAAASHPVCYAMIFISELLNLHFILLWQQWEFTFGCYNLSTLVR